MDFIKTLEHDVNELTRKIDELRDLEQNYIPEKLGKDHYMIKSNYVLARSNLILALSNIVGVNP